LVALAAVLRLGIAAVRYFQVDELQILHLAWLRVDGSVPGRDHAFPQFSLLIDLLELLWHLLGESLAGLWVARGATWLVGLGVVAAAWALARRLFGPAEALAAALTLSLMTDFSERVIEVRSDGLLVLCWLLAFAALTWAGREGRLGAFGAGLLAALALAFNFKALVALPFLALAAVLPPRHGRFGWREAALRLLLLGGGLAAGLAAYFGYLALRGDVALWVETAQRNLRVAGAPSSRFGPGVYMSTSLDRNVPFYTLLLGGLVLLGARYRDVRRLQWLPPLLLSAVYVWANPTFYTYNFVDVTPFWALAAGLGLVWLFERLPLRWSGVSLAVLALFAVVRLGFLLIPTVGDQITVNRVVLALTAPDERVYDASGLILFRRGPYHWRLHSLMLPRYYAGEFRLSEELSRQVCRVFIPSYRTLWLTREDASFLRRHYPLHRRGLGLLGWVFREEDFDPAGEARFSILAPGPYRLASRDLEVEAAFEIDGRPVREVQELEPGPHTLRRLDGGGPLGPTLLSWWPSGVEEQLERLPEAPRLWYGFDY
jgi:hypothetical protein